MHIFSILAQLKIDRTKINYDPAITNSPDGLTAILNMIYMWAGIIAVLVIIIAGFFFVTSRGDAAQMKRSKDAVRGGVVGLIIVMSAFAITRFIIGGVSQ